MKNLFKKVLTAAALCLTVLAVSGAVKANAAVTVTYEPATDTIKSDQKAVAYILKKADGVTLKSTATGIDLAANTAVSLTDDLGIKATNKDIYLYVVSEAITKDVTSAKPTFTLKGQQAKKLTGTINYTKADTATATGVLSAVAVDKDNKTIADPSIVWSTEEAGIYEAVDSFTGEELADRLANGATIYIKMLGNSTYRTSKAVKVKIAKQSKAPSVKLDVKKSTIALKNGYDFVLAAKTGENYALADGAKWCTVLPYLKDSGNANAIVPNANVTTGYIPLDKKDAAAKTSATAYTKTKVKALSLVDLAANLSTTEKPIKLADGFSFGVRKSATNKKPASAVTWCDLQAQAAAPVIYTEENTSSYDIIAQGTDVKFKTTDIANATWMEDKSNPWSGIGKNVEAKSGAKTDGTAAKYEMAVILEADLDNVDWSTVAWKAIKKGTSITEKTSTKYCLTGSTNKKTAVFTKTNAATTKGSANAKAVLLIRRAGVKGKTINNCVLASECMTTYLFKNTDGGRTVYQWITEGAKVGADAYQYVITVKTWQKGETDYSWTADATRTISGYAEVKKPATYTFEDPDGFAYDMASLSTGATATGKKIEIAAGTTTTDSKTVSINLQQKAKLVVKYDGLSTADKKNDSEVEVFLGVSKEITDKVLTVSGYTVKSVKIGTVDATVPSDKYSVTANTGKEVITITYEKAPEPAPEG